MSGCPEAIRAILKVAGVKSLPPFSDFTRRFEEPYQKVRVGDLSALDTLDIKPSKFLTPEAIKYIKKHHPKEMNIAQPEKSDLDFEATVMVAGISIVHNGLQESLIVHKILDLDGKPTGKYYVASGRNRTIQALLMYGPDVEIPVQIMKALVTVDDIMTAKEAALASNTTTRKTGKLEKAATFDQKAVSKAKPEIVQGLKDRLGRGLLAGEADPAYKGMKPKDMHIHTRILGWDILVKSLGAELLAQWKWNPIVLDMGIGKPNTEDGDVETGLSKDSFMRMVSKATSMGTHMVGHSNVYNLDTFEIMVANQVLVYNKYCKNVKDALKQLDACIDDAETAEVDRERYVALRNVRSRLFMNRVGLTLGTLMPMIIYDFPKKDRLPAKEDEVDGMMRHVVAGMFAWFESGYSKPGRVEENVLRFFLLMRALIPILDSRKDKLLGWATAMLSDMGDEDEAFCKAFFKWSKRTTGGWPKQPKVKLPWAKDWNRIQVLEMSKAKDKVVALRTTPKKMAMAV